MRAIRTFYVDEALDGKGDADLRKFMMIVIAAAAIVFPGNRAFAEKKDLKTKLAAQRGLDWLVSEQHRSGYWEANQSQYRVAMTALAGNAMLCEGSTTTRGRYSKSITSAVDYLIDSSQPNGLIGYKHDFHYTYGHGFSMLFLSQVFGEEENSQRREKLRDVLTRAVQFCGEAQTPDGGWGYVSAKDGNNFDEGSTCVTQVQGLRACRNAGIPVPKEIIDRAIEYIKKCKTKEGGIQYSLKNNTGPRPPISAAAIACLFSSGEYESDLASDLIKYCEANIEKNTGITQSGNHWHYTHFYYSQVQYRMGDEKWLPYFSNISKQILSQQTANGSWKEGIVGPVYVTAINSTILQLDNGFLPIYQR